MIVESLSLVVGAARAGQAPGSLASEEAVAGPSEPFDSSGVSAAGDSDGALFASGAGAAGGAGRRIDRRVTARTTAKARAASPATSAPVGEAVSVGEEVSATGVAVSAVEEDVLEDGLRVGKRPEALPPGLSDVVGAATPSASRPVSDELATSSDELAACCDEVAVSGDELAAPGAGEVEMLMDPDVSMAAGRLVALTMAVRFTEETVAAVVGTANWARSCRCAAAASTAPRLHEEVPLIPQPEVNTGVPAPVGDVCNWIVAADTLPPVAQADTAHVVACPRALLGAVGRTSTHKSTGVVVAAA